MKTRMTLLFCLIVCMVLFGPGMISVQRKMILTYNMSNTLTDFERNLMNLQKISCVKLDLSGDVAGKVMRFREVICMEGVFTEKDDEFGLPADTVSTITVMAQPVCADSIRVMIAVGRGRVVNYQSSFSAGNNPILIEIGVTDRGEVSYRQNGETGNTELIVAYPVDTEIPFAAYSAGIESEVIINGKKYSANDYCGLRDKMEHPRNWYEKYGIKNYVYYTVRFTD